MTSVPFQLEFPWSTLRSTANEGCATIKRTPHKIATRNHQKTAQKALFSLFFRLFYPTAIFLSILPTQRCGRQFLSRSTTISGWESREPSSFREKIGTLALWRDRVIIATIRFRSDLRQQFESLSVALPTFRTSGLQLIPWPTRERFQRIDACPCDFACHCL
jgi:hypothetical protein